MAPKLAKKGFWKDQKEASEKAGLAGLKWNDREKETYGRETEARLSKARKNKVKELMN